MFLFYRIVMAQGSNFLAGMFTAFTAFHILITIGLAGGFLGFILIFHPVMLVLTLFFRSWQFVHNVRPGGNAPLFVGSAFTGTVISTAGSVHRDRKITSHFHTLGQEIRHIQPAIEARGDRIGRFQIAETVLTENYPLGGAGCFHTVQGHRHRDLAYSHAGLQFRHSNQNLRSSYRLGKLVHNVRPGGNAAFLVGGTLTGAIVSAAGSVQRDGQIAGHFHTLGQEIGYIQPAVIAGRNRVGRL